MMTSTKGNLLHFIGLFLVVLNGKFRVLIVCDDSIKNVL